MPGSFFLESTKIRSRIDSAGGKQKRTEDVRGCGAKARERSVFGGRGVRTIREKGTRVGGESEGEEGRAAEDWPFRGIGCGLVGSG